MKLLLFFAYCICAIYGYDEKCSWGESHWCSSLNNAVGCGAVKHCKDTVWKYNLAYTQDTEDVCKFCTEMVGDVKKFLLDNETKETVKEYIDLACKQIPVPALEKVCEDTVEQNLDEVLKLIQEELDPKKICAILGLCAGFEDHSLRVISENSDIKEVSMVKGVSNVKGVLCDDCKKIVQDFIDDLKDPSNRKELEELIKLNICVQLPLQALKDACDSIVDEYIPEMADLIADSLDPLIMCETLELCDGDKYTFVKMRLQKSPLYQSLVKSGGSEECYVCTTAVSELKKVEEDPSMRNQLLQFLENDLCSHLGSYKSVCVDTIKNYGVQILDILSSELDPNAICNTFGFCQEASTVDSSIKAQSIMREIMPAAHVSEIIKQVQANVKVQAKNSIECSICEEVFGALEAELQNNKTLSRITQMLEKVCHMLPDTIKAQCTSFVETYSAAIVDLLLQSLTPEIACTELGFCSGNVSPWSFRLSEKSKVKLPEPNVDLCPICETVISTLDKYLEDNATKSEIKEYVQMLCDALPVLKDQCNEIVVANIDKIIDFLSEGISPEQICEEFGLCTGVKNLLKPFNVIQPVKVNLLGSNRCTWGPSYWCKSRITAKECGAIQHCEDNVWSKK